MNINKLGNSAFCNDYNIDFAYAVGGMFGGISSKEMVLKLANARMLGYLASGNIELEDLESNIKHIKDNTNNTFGVSLPCYVSDPSYEEKVVSLLIKHNVNALEASGFLWITPGLVLYRLKGLKKDINDSIRIDNKILVKLAVPKLASVFFSPPPANIVNKLLKEKKITAEEAELSKKVSMVDDICIEADSGGHTNRGDSLVLLPEVLRIRERELYNSSINKQVRIGIGGGIGTPNAASAAFALGADFIVTGSINQCTVEAGTSDTAKEILEKVKIGDTDYIPADDFSNKHQIQVVSKQILFPKRVHYLNLIYNLHNSIDEFSLEIIDKLESLFFNRSLKEVFNEAKVVFSSTQINESETNPKQKMLLIFKMYYRYSWEYAINGIVDQKSNFQICCGSSMGAFNNWFKSEFESWKARQVDQIGQLLMHETANKTEKYVQLFNY